MIVHMIDDRHVGLDKSFQHKAALIYSCSFGPVFGLGRIKRLQLVAGLPKAVSYLTVNLDANRNVNQEKIPFERCKFQIKGRIQTEL